jgi:DNA-binding MarR family transcriptional regulator
MTAEAETAAEVVRDRADVLIDLLGEPASGLETATKKLSVRVRRLANHVERELRRELAAEGIEVWEFEVLLALSRAPGQQLTAGALLRGSQVTAGAITNRVARLEGQGWVRRDIDPVDRRQVLVTLTPAGQRHADKILAINTTAEQRLLGQADPALIRRMSEDLRNLLLAIEGPALDEHPYEPRLVPKHKAATRNAAGQKAAGQAAGQKAATRNAAGQKAAGQAARQNAAGQEAEPG